jgi:hypothetical protein
MREVACGGLFKPKAPQLLLVAALLTSSSESWAVGGRGASFGYSLGVVLRLARDDLVRLTTHGVEDANAIDSLRGVGRCERVIRHRYSSCNGRKEDLCSAISVLRVKRVS